MTQRERTWLDNTSRRAGGFLSTFAMACYAADGSNFAILRPVLAKLMEKYPDYAIES